MTPTGPGTQAPNIYQGVVNGSNVTFFGIPIVPPGSNGQRVYRITGIRTNASTFSNGAAVQAFVQTSNPSALPISNAQPIVGFVSASLTTGAAPAVGFAQCVTQVLSGSSVGPVLTFSEANNFASAFKTRTDPAVPGQTAATPGQSATLVQNSPGTIYRSESGFMPPAAITGTTPSASSLLGSNIGLTDFGTRFHAVFTNLPAGANVYVSTTNVNVAAGVATSPVAAPAPTATNASYAILVSSDTAPEVTSLAPPATSSAVGTIPVIQINTVGSTTATATWEVINTQPTAVDTFQFAVYVTYTASPGTNSPAVGTTSVNLWYAPTSTVIQATSGDPIPRFLDAWRDRV